MCLTVSDGESYPKPGLPSCLAVRVRQALCVVNARCAVEVRCGETYYATGWEVIGKLRKASVVHPWPAETGDIRRSS